MVILQRNHIAELFLQDKLGCRYAEPACQHTVGRAGSAAALVMARNGNADLLTGQFLQLVRNAVGDGRIVIASRAALNSFLLSLASS